jgi:hypothetical protein
MHHLASGSLMTAEGLTRSAIGDLDNSHARGDGRYAYERALILRGYGQMLEQWDKREGEGRKLIADADQVISNLPKYGDQNIRLSCLVHVPAVVAISSSVQQR